MPITVIEGEQRGDEGKGRFVDMLMPDFDIGARFNGGDNAGHTIVKENGEIFKVHGLPSSIVHDGKKSVIGNGTVVNPVRLTEEIAGLQGQGITIGVHNLLISGGAHLTLPHHRLEDEYRERGILAQGSTKSGIAQAYSAKAGRIGVRAECIRNRPDELFSIACDGLRRVRLAHNDLTAYKARDDREKAREFVGRAQQVGNYVTDTVLFLNQELRKDTPSNVLAEGAQAFLLDIDHGMYPFVTSSSTTSAGAAIGLGVPGKYINRVVGISKAIQSHVGGGPFVTEIHDSELLSALHGNMGAIDAERGTTTGRIRRLGHLDLPQIRRAQMVNGTDEAGITKFDWLSRYPDKIPICVGYRRKGKTLTIAPDAAYKLEQCEPIYEYLPNCKTDISGVKTFEALPPERQEHIRFIEQYTGVPITMIGVGPARDQVIVRSKQP